MPPSSWLHTWSEGGKWNKNATNTNRAGGKRNGNEGQRKHSTLHVTEAQDSLQILSICWGSHLVLAGQVALSPAAILALLLKQEGARRFGTLCGSREAARGGKGESVGKSGTEGGGFIKGSGRGGSDGTVPPG